MIGNDKKKIDRLKKYVYRNIIYELWKTETGLTKYEAGRREHGEDVVF